MKIAVAYNNGEINEHFGHCEYFAVYDYYGTYTNEVNKTLIDARDKSGHTDMVNLMKDNKIDVVIVGRMGEEARAMLLSDGIVPVTGYCGNADQAVELLVTGQLPMSGEGGCGGGCGGCGGGCHSDGDEGECGCGCGCGH